MIYVHTYEYIFMGEKDYIQFYEYPKGHLFVCESHDIPHLAIVSPRRHKLYQSMENAVYQDIAERFKSYPTKVSKLPSQSFDIDEFDMSL